MTRFALLFAGPLVLLVALVTSGCGSNRQLQSVTLTPASAEAQDFSDGQVPFVAVGTFSNPPSPMNLTSKDVLWCVGDTSGRCVGNIAPPVNVEQNGLAQCNPTFVGTATVLAGTGSGTVMPDSGPQLKIFGSAQLTCP
jgi:hypothetical protein